MGKLKDSLNDVRAAGETRPGLKLEALKRDIAYNLFYLLGKSTGSAGAKDFYTALAYLTRGRLESRWINTAEKYHQQKGIKVVCYLSAEFLIGPQLAKNLLYLDLYEPIRQAVAEFGLDLDEILEQEPEPGLGNGGLGRLAACYLDSLSTLGFPAIGYGIRYEFGIFEQQIRDGWQIEVTDKWLQCGSPWEFLKPEVAYDVKFGGYTQAAQDEEGRYRVHWIPAQVVKGIAADYPIAGYKINSANTLRLWKAEACESFDFQAFNMGDYYAAVDQKVVSENITKVLYPNDEPWVGKQLRLKQQYFFISCSLQDMIKLHLARGENLERFHECFAVQLNDTHPAIAIAELMRLFVDEHRLDWDQSWRITQNTFAYTNHTLLPEALEKWPLPLFRELLPRHLEIIFEINRRFLDRVRLDHPECNLADLSLIDESGEKYVRMAHLASLGSHAINGVSELHSDLLRRDVLKDFYGLMPHKFSNKTNGVTPRRFIRLSNPKLAALITQRIGENWLKDLGELARLEDAAEDAGFRASWKAVKRENKARLAAYIERHTGVRVDPDSLYDVQVKRLHEYKRQHLNMLHIITLYHIIRQNPNADLPPRTFIFAGKAAPGYFMAKLIIKLIHAVAEVVNRDAGVRERLRVVFIPNFNVKTSHWIYPAADLSEQISTAGKEASGTGNMKFSMNGALTIGTLDGANIEIREAVGAENFFLFGLNADQVYEIKAAGYDPRTRYASNDLLREAIDAIGTGAFSHGDTELFRPLVNALLDRDDYLVLADYPSYVTCQQEVGRVFLNPDTWARKSILNTARMERFSSDRAIQEYCRDIWHVEPILSGPTLNLMDLVP
jgi:starch phosphorylase